MDQPITAKPPHVVRMEAEHSELKERLGKLMAFMAGDVFKTLPGDERVDMDIQSKGMRVYLAAIESRIARANGTT